MITCTRPTTAMPSTASPTARDTNWRWRASRLCSRWGNRLMRTMLLEAPHGEPARDEQQRRIGRKLARTNPLRGCHVRERVADNGIDARPLGDQLVEAGQKRAATTENDLVDLAVRGRSEKELQRAGDFQREGLHERLQDIGMIVLRQPGILFGRLCFFRRQIERPLNIVGQLVTAESLIARE